MAKRTLKLYGEQRITNGFVLPQTVKIIKYIKQSAAGLYEVTIQQCACLNWRTGSGNGSNCH